MKKVSTLFKILLGFAAGIVSGAFIHLGFEILENRPVSVGGEALIIPLIVLLFCLGFSVGKEVKVQGRFHRAYRKGYQDGYDTRKAEQNVERIVTVFVPAREQPFIPPAASAPGP